MKRGLLALGCLLSVAACEDRTAHDLEEVEASSRAKRVETTRARAAEQIQKTRATATGAAPQLGTAQNSGVNE